MQEGLDRLRIWRELFGLRFLRRGQALDGRFECWSSRQIVSPARTTPHASTEPGRTHRGQATARHKSSSSTRAAIGPLYGHGRSGAISTSGEVQMGIAGEDPVSSAGIIGWRTIHDPSSPREIAPEPSPCRKRCRAS